MRPSRRKHPLFCAAQGWPRQQFFALAAARTMIMQILDQIKNDLPGIAFSAAAAHHSSSTGGAHTMKCCPNQHQ